MKKNIQNIQDWYFIVGIIAVIGIIWFGGTQGWFKSSYSIVLNQSMTEKLEGTSTGGCSLSSSQSVITSGDTISGSISNGKNSRCDIYGKDTSTGEWIKVKEVTTNSNGQVSFSQVFNPTGSFVFVVLCDSNNNGYFDVQDCLTNKVSLTVNPKTTINCVDSDGDDRYTPGHVTYDGLSYYDKCLEIGNGVTEYICQNGIPTQKNWACDYRETCITTRSGGYCSKPIDSGYEVGDVVGSIDFNENLVGGDESSVWMVGLSGIETGGTCYLGAKVWTSWDYANDKCSGIIGDEGMEWAFQDSEGIKWFVTDDSPQSHYEDLCPLVWDGKTDWRLFASKTFNLPECVIETGGRVEVYVCECQ